MKTAIAVGLLLGVVLYWRFFRDDDAGSAELNSDDGGTLVTAGDDESNVFLDTMDKFKNWPAGSDPYRGIIESAATINGVPVQILAWLLWKESRYNPEIINGTKRSRVGAMGIAQFMPKTARDELGSEQAALDPAIAIPGAARYLRKLFGRAGSWEGALAAYNWGIGNLTRKGIDAAPDETVDYYTEILAKAGGGTVA